MLVLVVLALIGFAIFASMLGQPSVPTNSVLVLNVSGSLPDYTPDDPVAEALGMSAGQSFSGLLTQLRKAKVDDRIGGVLIDINFPGIGWAKADELRDAIKDVRSAGKPVYAYMEIGTNKEYYIATAAEKIFLPPPGDIYINGLTAEAMFFKGSLEKLGVDTDVIQIGPKYKNAPDQYTKKEMGEGQREVTNALLDEFYGRLVNGIAESRQLSPDAVKGLIDNAPYNARQAKELKLIDEAFYRDQVYQEFQKRLGYKETDKLRTVSTSRYSEVTPDSLGLNKGEKIAVIYASGAINIGRSSDGTFGGSMAGSDTIVAAINDAANDGSVKAIVLRVDSPGGSALASDLMWNAVENAKTKKPVVVSMADVAASGGYYIACNADAIVAQPSTITGSIGMFMGKPVVKGLYEWLGVSNEYVSRGKNSGIFKETEHWTDGEREKMTAHANSVYYDMFLPKVANGRNKSVEEADALGQGRVWTGTQAKERGLVDEFGGMEKAIEIAKTKAGISAEKEIRRVVFPAPTPLLESLFKRDDRTSLSSEQQAQKALADAMPEDLRRVFRYSAMFDQMKRGDAMLLLPFELTIK